MEAPAPSLPEIANEGPVLNLLNKHLRALREKLSRISQIEESRAQAKPLNKEQEETLRSKPYAIAGIVELEKIRQPLLSAVDQEIKLVLAKHSQKIASEGDAAAELAGKEQSGDASAVSDLLNLLYFVRIFDLETLMRAKDNVVRRTQERNCWLTYDSVRDDGGAGDPLKEFDLNLIARVGGLLISRPVNSSLSHKESLEKCADHAKLWLANADQPIEAASTITYAGLRKKINRIMTSHYFTTTPEIKAPVDVVAAAAGNGMNPNPNPINLALYPDVKQRFLLWCKQNGKNINSSDCGNLNTSQSIPITPSNKGPLGFSGIHPKLSRGSSSHPKRKKLSSSGRYSTSEDDDAIALNSGMKEILHKEPVMSESRSMDHKASAKKKAKGKAPAMEESVGTQMPTESRPMGQKAAKRKAKGKVVSASGAIKPGQAEYLDPIVKAMVSASMMKTLKSAMKLWREAQNEELRQMYYDLIQMLRSELGL